MAPQTPGSQAIVTVYKEGGATSTSFLEPERPRRRRQARALRPRPGFLRRADGGQRQWPDHLLAGHQLPVLVPRRDPPATTPCPSGSGAWRRGSREVRRRRQTIRRGRGSIGSGSGQGPPDARSLCLFAALAAGLLVARPRRRRRTPRGRQRRGARSSDADRRVADAVLARPLPPGGHKRSAHTPGSACTGSRPRSTPPTANGNWVSARRRRRSQNGRLRPVQYVAAGYRAPERDGRRGGDGAPTSTSATLERDRSTVSATPRSSSARTDRPTPGPTACSTTTTPGRVPDQHPAGEHAGHRRPRVLPRGAVRLRRPRGRLVHGGHRHLGRGRGVRRRRRQPAVPPGRARWVGRAGPARHLQRRAGTSTATGSGSATSPSASP